MPTENINGIDIHYRDTGGEGFPVVLAHGYTGNSRNWALTAPALRERFRVISPDHRGHGLSGRPERPEDHELELMAADLYGLLTQIGVQQCYLVGHSMGGMVAQLLVLEHPEMVRGLVLVDTAAEVPSIFHDRYEERARFVKIAEEQGMGAAFEAQLAANVDPRVREHPEFLAIWREQFLMTSKEAYIGAARAMAGRRSIVGRLNEIRVPTLVICGEKDTPFLGASRTMQETIAGSELVIIPGAGHTPQIETPAEFNRVLASFFDRVHAAAAATA